MVLIAILALMIVSIFSKPIPDDVKTNIHWVPTKVHLKAGKKTISNLKNSAMNKALSFDEIKYHTTNAIGTDTSVISFVH